MNHAHENDGKRQKKTYKRKSSLWLNQPKKRKVETGTPNASTITTVKPSSSRLKAAPRKSLSQRKSRKQLFSSTVSEQTEKEMLNILPSVLSKLKGENLMIPFCMFLRLISTDKFPLHNIALLLFLDVVRWYSLENTSQMIYSPECMKFWKVMYRLFHGKALRFMAGMKSSNHNLDMNVNKGHIDPNATSINFAVPTQKYVTDFETSGTDIPKEIPAGIISQALNVKDKNKEYVVSFDGKKLAPGLSKDKGDQDLFGHEAGESLYEAKKRVDREIKCTTELTENWKSLSKQVKIEKLQSILELLSLRIKDLRGLYLKQKQALNKFMNEGGEDWRNSKYVFAISSIQSQLHIIRSTVKRLLDANDSLLQLGATLNSAGCLFTTEQHVDIFSQSNIVTFKDMSDIPQRFLEHSRFVKQRSPQWFELRKKSKVTGSTIYGAIGLDTLKKQQAHFDTVVHGIIQETTIPDDVQKRMDHGTVSEIHAITTLASKVLPFYLPELTYVEEGAHEIQVGNEPLILVSPDGSLCLMEKCSNNIPTPLYACEFKCPSANDYKTPVHYEILLRYITQLLGEMKSMDVDSLIYLCWTEESSTVIRCSFNKELWDLIQQEAESVYSVDDKRRPSRLSTGSKLIQSELKEYRQKYTKFICEVRSVTATSLNISQCLDDSPYLFPVCTAEENEHPDEFEDVEAVLSNVSLCLKETYQVCRKKATEVLVWMLSDTDRRFNPEIPYTIPIAYGMKGYSLGTKSMREMHDHVLQSCYEQEIDVICSCFDGQWAKMANRDKNDKPLTIIQLQKDTHVNASRSTRDTIVKEISSSDVISRLKNDMVIEKSIGSAMFVSSSLLSRVMRSSVNKSKLAKCSEIVQSEDTLSCLPDEALETLIETQNVEQEFLSTTVNENEFVCPINLNEETDAGTGDEITESSLTTSNTLEEPLSGDTLGEILLAFRTNPKLTISNKWKELTVQDLQNTLTDIQSLQKLQHAELNIIIEKTEIIQKSKGVALKKSCVLAEKVHGISKLTGITNNLYIKKVKNMMTLQTIASKVVRFGTKAIPKERLNNVKAALSFDKSYNEWADNAPFGRRSQIDGFGETEWFSHPEFNEERQKFEPKCLDSHHLLVNLRVKVCKDGLQGIRKSAWLHVADSDNDIISKGIVFDLLDKQNNAYAKKTFSKAVEDQMRLLHYDTEADFCHLIREWYKAEDSPGLSAIERIQRRLRLKEFLLNKVEFGVFPPPGAYIKGFPKGMFEGFIQRIDTTIQLHAISKSGSYNQRSISSLVNETFFGELSEMEPTKLGCPKAVSIPRLMSTVTEIQQYRCDPSERSFHMNTTRKSVYQRPGLLSAEAEQTNNHTTAQRENVPMIQCDRSCVTPRNHAFDNPRLYGKKQRKSKRSDVSKPHEVARGCLPVRFHHKSDESKILSTTRLGIDLQSSNQLTF